MWESTIFSITGWLFLFLFLSICRMGAKKDGITIIN